MDECRNPRPSWETCIHAFAGGWILASDLCPTCTATMMDALTERAPGGALKWHKNYLERASLGDHGPSVLATRSDQDSEKTRMGRRARTSLR